MVPAECEVAMQSARPSHSSNSLELRSWRQRSLLHSPFQIPIPVSTYLQLGWVFISSSSIFFFCLYLLFLVSCNWFDWQLHEIAAIHIDDERLGVKLWSNIFWCRSRVLACLVWNSDPIFFGVGVKCMHACMRFFLSYWEYYQHMKLTFTYWWVRRVLKVVIVVLESSEITKGSWSCDCSSY